MTTMTTMWHDFNTAVQAIDVAAMDRAGLGGLAGEIGRTRAVLDGLEARIATGLRRFGASEASAAETLRRRTGCSTREAKHRTRRAETLKKMPNVAEALSSGRLTGEHASALARAAAETSPEAVDRDAGLLAEASSVPADAASTKARDWVRRRQTDDDLQSLHQWQRRNRSLLFAAGEGGMITGIARLDRVSGAQLQNLVEALADRLYRADGGRDNPHARTRAQCRHDALLTLVGIEPAPPPHPEHHTPSPASTDANSNGHGNGPASHNASSDGHHIGPASRNASPDGHHTNLNGHHTTPEAASNGQARPKLAMPCQEPLPDPNASPATDPPADPASNPEPSPTRTPGILPGWSGSGSGPGFGPGVSLDTISGLGPGASVGCTCGRGFGPKAQLCVVMDVTYLATNGERGRCEIPGVGAIARSELQRLGCDSEMYGILFDQRGLPLYHGRKTRRVSPQQWRVLLARDRGCVVCGAHPIWCQAHHVKYWSLGGPTDIDNLALLCHAHHRWVHDNEITLQRGPDGWQAPPGLPPPGLPPPRRSIREPIRSPDSA